jgi:hypothetical protein
MYTELGKKLRKSRCLVSLSLRGRKADAGRDRYFKGMKRGLTCSVSATVSNLAS